MEQSLPFVRSISFVDTYALENVALIHGVGAIVGVLSDFTELPIVGLARCEVASVQENRTTLFTTTLTAHLSSHFDSEHRHLAFLITCVDGSRFLIGGKERPFATVNTSDIFPDKASEASGCTLTVEYTDTFGLTPVID